MNKQEILHQLREINVIKHGDFILKSGVCSSIYIDLRPLISYPKILRAVSHLMWEKMQGLSYELICGIPYTALPMATCIAVDHDIPMLLVRKEAKEYGTKKQVEGVFSPGQTCVIVEDVVTSGGSVLGSTKVLQKEGLIIRDVVCFIEREQGGRENLQACNYKLHSIFALSELT